MTPAAALVAVPADEPRHHRTYPRIGSVWSIDQVKCLERAKMLLEAALSECATGEIEGDWISGAIDNIDLAVPRIEERLASREAAAEIERETGKLYRGGRP